MNVFRVLIPVLMITCFVGCTSTPGGERIADAGAAAPARTDPLEAGFQLLADRIVEGLDSREARKIAIVHFQDLNGRVSEFGGLLAEEMITRLYRTGRFQVVERELLNKVLDEHQLNFSGLVDESTAREIGKLLGVDAIASGSVTDLGSEIRVNSRLISTETGSVFAAAGVTLARDARIDKLLERTLAPGGAPARTGGAVETDYASPDEYRPGLVAEFYNLTAGAKRLPVGDPVFTRVDPAIDFDYASGSPVPRIQIDWFGIRWSGFINIPRAGAYTFSLLHDDNLKLWIDGEKIHDHVYTQGRWITRDVTFEKSGWVPFKAEFIETVGGAACRIRWATPGAADFEVLPAEAFGHRDR